MIWQKSICIITANTGNGLDHCTGKVQNCIISGNFNHGLGYSFAGSGQVINCVIVGNKGCGLYGETYGWPADIYVSNSIIVKNWQKGLALNVSRPYNLTSKYNNVWNNLGGNYSGTTPGPGDISENPLFAMDGYWDAYGNWVNGDYHLFSTAGRWDPTAQSWVTYPIDSPCLDAGDPTSPIGLEPFPNRRRNQPGRLRRHCGGEQVSWTYVPGTSNNGLQQRL